MPRRSPAAGVPICLAAPLLILLAAFTMATPSFAATTPPGVNLRWNVCYDDGGVANKAFSCDTNSGGAKLVLSFVLDTPTASVSGMEASLEFRSASAGVPDWWQFNVGACRPTGLFISTTSAPSTTPCTDWIVPNTSGYGFTYDVGFFGPNTVRMNVSITGALGSLASFVPNQEYVVLNLIVDDVKTVGSGACAGCDVPMCIAFSQLRINTPQGTVRTLSRGANDVASQLAIWQNGAVVNPHVINLGGAYTTMDGCSLGPTGTRISTWRAVKALYR